MSSDFFRSFGTKLASLLLTLLLFVAAGAGVMRFVISEPAAVKETISKSGIYDNLIDASLEETKKPIKLEGIGEIAPNDPLIKDPLNEAYSPEVLKTNIESVIDGTYRWLNGTASQPDFVLNLSTQNEAFIQGVGNKLDERLRSLPPCTIAQLREQQETGNILRASCLPPGVSSAQIIQQVQSRLRSNKDILPDQRITVDTFKRTGETQNVFASANNAPEQFQLIKQTPWVLVIMIALLAAVIVMLAASRTEGFMKLGKILAISGVLLLLIPLGLYFVQSTLIDQQTINASPIAKDVTLPLLTEFGKAATKVYLVIGSLVLATGASIWFATRRMSDTEK